MKTKLKIKKNKRRRRLPPHPPSTHTHTHIRERNKYINKPGYVSKVVLDFMASANQEKRRQKGGFIISYLTPSNIAGIVTFPFMASPSAPLAQAPPGKEK